MSAEDAEFFAVKFAAISLQRNGHERIVTSSDDEHSSVSLEKKAVQFAHTEAVPEDCPCSHGDVRCAEGGLLIRIVKKDSKYKPKIEISNRHRANPGECIVETSSNEKNQKRGVFQFGELMYAHGTTPKAERQAHALSVQCAACFRAATNYGYCSIAVGIHISHS